MMEFPTPTSASRCRSFMVLVPPNVLNGQKGLYIRKRDHVRISTYRLDSMLNIYMPVKITESTSVDSC